jgi:hypothetical protein
MKKANHPTRPIMDIKPPAVLNGAISLKKKIKRYKIALTAVLIVVILLAGFLYHLHENSLNKAKGPSSQSQINKTVNEVGKLMLLPSGEQPTLAIVNNASQYRSVSFFKDAENGDELLVYAQAREAILYRPSINKIISVAPLNVSNQSSNSTPSK